MPSLETLPAWQTLLDRREAIRATRLVDLFDADPTRFDQFSLESEGLLLDYSKQPVDAATWQALLALAEACDLPAQREAMFNGTAVNSTEDRAALHTALRQPAAEPGPAGEAIHREVMDTRTRMAELAERIRSGEYMGATGKPIRHVINIGIGGSDLGPRLVLEALAPMVDGPAVHFVANVDGVELERALAVCDPETTLVLVVSKSFGTVETMANAHEAMAWLRRRVPSDAVIERQVLAITANLERVRALGLDPALALPMRDWVGGRYSLWSAVGFAIQLGIGSDCFEALLAGAHGMDQHFRQAPLDANMPVILGLLSVFNGTLLGRRSQAVVPYTERLGRLSAYLQQLVMESNGKSVDRLGNPVAVPTAGAIWGQTGTPGQHAFFQALHQGTDVVPVDFIGVIRPVAGERGDPLELTAHLFAQSQALMQGRGGADVPAARACPGNRPSNTVLIDALTPERLGALIALYEHRTFVEAAVWGINPFDQFGVELGKGLAADLKPLLGGATPETPLDGSTAGLIARYRG
ncbi:glucose-6-phosphate isomerase [Spiribacter salinus]|uniref:glucose-6-phosphate isomerase n=1 Tax=Spiribacter salinus TaxID=1335746 RepID=UPI001C956240|nr:glucose-6-phosphate isomerase [Spiribacter salinus]MBY5267860.1 glucose-6-phosphate isomerase [Spiribacter salinus]